MSQQYIVLRPCVRGCIVFMLISCCNASSSAGLEGIRTVVLSGTPAPGDPDVFFQSAVPILNNSGQTAFRANIFGPGITADNDLSLWSEGSGQLRMVAREGQLAPGAPPGSVFDRLVFAFEELNNAGTLAFSAELDDGASPLFNRSLWEANANGLSLIARPGQQPVGAPPGYAFHSISGASQNNLNESAFLATLEGPGSPLTTYWKHGPNGLTPLLFSEDPLPGADGSLVLSGGTGPPDINDDGVLTFFGQARSQANTLARGAWSGAPGALELVALEGDHAPGTMSGISFRDFLRTPFNNERGKLSFLASLQGAGIDDSNDEGIWSNALGGLHAVARKGSPAPGSGGALFGDFFGDPHLNDAGQLAFRAQLAGPGVTSDNDNGLWFEDSSGVSLLAREGDPAPGAEPDVVFGDFFASPYPALNDHGIVAFQTTLAGPGINPNNDGALWLGRPGDLQLVLRDGDTIDVDDGPDEDIRTISRILFHNNGLQGEGALNDVGQLAFYADFTDGTGGVFVLDSIYVPEPSVALWTFMLLLVIRAHMPGEQ